MKQDIEDFINRCLDCQLKKLVRVKTRHPLLITDTPPQAFHKVVIIQAGPLNITANGNVYILTAQCLWTKFAQAYAIPDGAASTIAEVFIRRFISIFGYPKQLLTDSSKFCLKIA